jgi:hypothetical protein
MLVIMLMRLDAFLAHLDQFVPGALLLQLPALEVKSQILLNQRVSIRKRLVIMETFFITLNACHAQLDQAAFLLFVTGVPHHSRAKGLATGSEIQHAALALI